jgi:hypothetical protein
MGIKRASAFAAALAAAFAAAGCLSGVEAVPGDTLSAASDRRALADATVGQWSDPSALAARLLIQEYGTPNEVDFEHLIWVDQYPWRRVIVRNVRPFFIEDADRGIVEQTIADPLTPAQAAAVATAFGARAAYDARSGELSARSDRESFNYLLLNLSHDVVVGTVRPEQARDAYAKIIELQESGKTSPYLLGLSFMRER